MTIRQAISLTPDQREVLLGMVGMDTPVRTVREQASSCGLTVEAWRTAARALIDLRLAEYGTLVGCDGRPKGSGYFRTDAGDALAAQLESRAE